MVEAGPSSAECQDSTTVTAGPTSAIREHCSTVLATPSGNKAIGKMAGTHTERPKRNIRNKKKKKDNVVMLTPQRRTETVIVLDDDDDSDIEIKIERIVPEDVNPDPVLTNTVRITSEPSKSGITQQHQPIDRKTPQQTTAYPITHQHNLTLNPKTPEPYPVAMTSFVLGFTGGSYTLSPIVMSDGVPILLNDNVNFVIPVSENIVSGKGINHDQNIIDITREDTMMVATPASVLNEENRKRGLENTMMMETPNKVKKVLPTHAVPDPKRIDWEDKIPAEVISFMNAVNPHPDPIFTRLKPNSRGPHVPESTMMPIVQNPVSLNPDHLMATLQQRAVLPPQNLQVEPMMMPQITQVFSNVQNPAQKVPFLLNSILTNTADPSSNPLMTPLTAQTSRIAMTPTHIQMQDSPWRYANGGQVFSYTLQNAVQMNPDPISPTVAHPLKILPKPDI